MDGFSRWDLVFWVVFAYAAVVGVLMAVHHRGMMMQRFRDALRAIHRGARG